MRLDCERLDDRTLPSGITYAAGVVTITGTPGNDGVYVTTDYAHWGVGVYLLTNGQITDHQVFPIGSVQKVVADLGAGNDLFSDGTQWGIFDAVHGGDGNDSIYGGQGGGALFGDAGSDFLYSVDHADWARVRPNEVYMDGGAGADRVYCGYGPDAVVYDPADSVTNFSYSPDVYGFTDRWVV